MNKNITFLILSVFVMSMLMMSCESPQDINQTIDYATSKTIRAKSKAEDEIIAAFEKILVAVGNRNSKDLGELCTDKANVGWTYLKDGEWLNKEITVEEYLQKIEEKINPKPIAETTEEYDIYVTEDRLALLRAETIISQFGIARSREVNNAIMIKEGDDWKLSGIAWTVHRIPEEEREFDLNLFAHNYAQVWGSNRSEFVAMFFEEEGSLQVNDGNPAVGRKAISNVAQSFMTQFPDMNVNFDSLSFKNKGVEFHWTLTGTDADPKGKSHQVKISGVELWTLSPDNLIMKSKGSFSSEEYNKQLEFGVSQ